VRAAVASKQIMMVKIDLSIDAQARQASQQENLQKMELPMKCTVLVCCLVTKLLHSHTSNHQFWVPSNWLLVRDAIAL